jgi:imidazoleglycerol-phosphate dehydratase
MNRTAQITRKTGETDVALTLGLDGTGTGTRNTSVGFLDHMLDLVARHGRFDLDVNVSGDLETGAHHTVEDTGIVLGQALDQALGDRRGIVRFGSAAIPMDETLVSAAVDISGRPFIVFNVPLNRARVANFDLDLLKDFFRAFAFNAELNLHVNLHYGENLHHIAEAVFKAVGRAVAQATRLDPRIAGVVPSTKGSLGS